MTGYPYGWQPHVHEVERAGKVWRCLAKGCGWTGGQGAAVAHAIKHQWTEPHLRPPEPR
jgi:hypothetical protein